MSKLDGIKPGDRVRVTFEARVLEGDEYSSDTLGVALDGSHAGECVLFPTRQRNAPTFQIERIEPPLKVGDMVKNIFCRNHSRAGKLEAIVTVDGKEYAIVSGFSEIPGVGLLSEYERNQ